MSVSLKVPVALLLKNAEAKLAAVKAESQAPTARYEKALRKWRARATRAVQDLLFALEDAQAAVDAKNVERLLEKVIPDGGSGVRFTVKVGKAPTKPYYNRYTHADKVSCIEADIKLLKATSQTDLTVRAGGNFSEYL